MADLTAKVQPPLPSSTEMSDAIFKITGERVSAEVLAAVRRAMSAGAEFEGFLALMDKMFKDDPVQAREALNGFASYEPEKPS